MERRVRGWMFWLLLAAACAPFWGLSYFPSQDGPSHLHNAAVMADYGREPGYQRYYQLDMRQPAGNLLTHLLLAGLWKVAGSALSEKLLLTGYAFLLAFSFRYLLWSVSEESDSFSLFVFLLLPNFFLHMGFWNFAYSIGLLCLTLGYFLRRRGQRWKPAEVAVLGLCGLLLYLSHAVSWLVCVGAAGLYVLMEMARERAGVTAVLGRYLAPGAALGMPAVALLTYLKTSQEEQACVGMEGVGERILNAVLPALHSYAASDRMVAKAVVLLLAMAGAAVLWRGVRLKSWEWQRQVFLGMSGICCALIVLGPDCIGTGGFIHRRMGYYALFFTVLWLASQVWQPWVLRALAVAVCGIALGGLVARWPVYRHWEGALRELAKTGEMVRHGSTVLPVYWERPTDGVSDPYRHAIGILSGRAIINLNNYEASVEYFATRFRPEYNPFVALGSLKDLESVPPRFEISRYERETKGRVDYVVFFGRADVEKGVPWLEEQIRVNGEAVFEPVNRNAAGSVRLYRRER